MSQKVATVPSAPIVFASHPTHPHQFWPDVDHMLELHGGRDEARITCMFWSDESHLELAFNGPGFRVDRRLTPAQARTLAAVLIAGADGVESQQ